MVNSYCDKRVFSDDVDDGFFENKGIEITFSSITAIEIVAQIFKVFYMTK